MAEINNGDGQSGLQRDVKVGTVSELLGIIAQVRC